MPPRKTSPKPKGKIVFKGDIVEYFIKTFLTMILIPLTFGLAFPYFIWWQVNYFIKHSEIKIG